MPSGTYFHGLLTAGVVMATDAVPEDKIRSVEIQVINDTDSAVDLDLYICLSPDNLAGRRIEPTLKLPAGGLYRLSGAPVSAGERVAIRVSGAGITARVVGFEESL